MLVLAVTSAVEGVGVLGLGCHQKSIPKKIEQRTIAVLGRFHVEGRKKRLSKDRLEERSSGKLRTK